MHIDSIKNGIVIDHITAGRGMELYHLLGLDKLDCSIAIIKNVHSNKMGKKDIIKVDGEVVLDMKILGYVDPGVTVDIIKDGALVEKKRISLPSEIKNVIFCKNPRCITNAEDTLDHVFKLTDEANRTYRCIYCEMKAKNSKI